jgi:hypothetical protein
MEAGADTFTKRKENAMKDLITLVSGKQPNA